MALHWMSDLFRTAAMNLHAGPVRSHHESRASLWWRTLNEEGRPCTNYSPWQKAQRILYREALTALVGIGIFFCAWYGGHFLEWLSGYDPVSKTGNWAQWCMYWVAMIFKLAVVASVVFYVAVSNILIYLRELVLQVWELVEEFNGRAECHLQPAPSASPQRNDATPSDSVAPSNPLSEQPTQRAGP
jgi:hypothetical protein